MRCPHYSPADAAGNDLLGFLPTTYTITNTVFVRVFTDGAEPVIPNVVNANDLGRDMQHVAYGEDMPPHRLFWFDHRGEPVEVHLTPHPEHRPAFNSDDYATYIWQVVPVAYRGERRVICEVSCRIDGRA